MAKYYKATAEAYDYFTGHTLIENELVTEKERNTKFRYIGDYYFKPIYLDRSDYFWSFGCRFECKN